MKENQENRDNKGNQEIKNKKKKKRKTKEKLFLTMTTREGSNSAQDNGSPEPILVRRSKSDEANALVSHSFAQNERLRLGLGLGQLADARPGLFHHRPSTRLPGRPNDHDDGGQQALGTPSPSLRLAALRATPLVDGAPGRADPSCRQEVALHQTRGVSHHFQSLAISSLRKEQVQVPQHGVCRHRRPCLSANSSCRTSQTHTHAVPKHLRMDRFGGQTGTDET